MMVETEANIDMTALTVTGEPEAASLEGRRVLVAEDNVILSMHLSLVLERAGATVLGPYPDAAEALTALKGSSAPDAAVLDYWLAEGDSSQIASRLTDMHVPFAFFTSHDPDELQPWSESAPVLTKPTDDREIVDTMTGLLSGQ